MINKKVTLTVGAETLAGRILHGRSPANPPKFIFAHGGGTYSCKERVEDIAEEIISCGINILAIDHSGHGESSGFLKKSSLEKRVTELRAAIDQFAAPTPLILYGASMGGYVAIKMLEFYPVETLILLCPALYTSSAYTIPFDMGFTEIIRSPESWRNTDVLPILESFTGQLLVIIGDQDAVIPEGVIDLIMKHTPNARKKELYKISNCPHIINQWLVDRPLDLQKFRQKIIEFVQAN